MKSNIDSGDVVFDMASGKGGDLNKWRSCKVKHVTFADVASESVEQSKERFVIVKTQIFKNIYILDTPGSRVNFRPVSMLPTSLVQLHINGNHHWTIQKNLTSSLVNLHFTTASRQNDSVDSLSEQLLQT